MKQLVIWAGMSLLAASCSNESVDIVDNALAEMAVTPVRVQVSGFSVSQEDLSADTRATAVGSYNGVQVLTLAFYKNDDTEVFKREQLKSDNTTFTTFGEFECSLLKISSLSIEEVRRPVAILL